LPLVIDNSQLSCFQSCPMKYYLTYVLNLRKRKVDLSEIDKEFGQRVHSCLDCYYRGEALDYDKLWQGFEDLPEEVEVEKTRANGIRLMEEYVKEYQARDKQSIEVLGVEEIYKYPISEDIIWLVKIDTAIRQNDNVYSLEHKTTKALRYDYFYQFSPNQQITGQVFALNQEFRQCSGVIIDAMEVGFRKRAYKGEPAGFHCKFQREIINRNKEQIEDFKQNVIKSVRRLERTKADGLWEKNEGACHSYRGCQFKEICLTSIGLKLDEEIKEVLYEVRDNKEYLKGKEGE